MSRSPLAGLVLGLLAAPLRAHPVDENLLRCEVRLLLQTGGLRAELRAMHGGLAAVESWPRADADGDGALGADEQRAWAERLFARVAVTLDSRALPWAPAAWEFPDHGRFMACEAPILVVAETPERPPAGRPVDLAVTVDVDDDWPQFSRVVLIAPATVLVTDLAESPGRTAARVLWPAAGAPLDTRLSAAPDDDWFWALPEGLSAVAQPPRSGRAAIVPATAGRPLSGWLVGLLAAGLLAAGAAAGRRRIGR